MGGRGTTSKDRYAAQKLDKGASGNVAVADASTPSAARVLASAEGLGGDGPKKASYSSHAELEQDILNAPIEHAGLFDGTGKQFGLYQGVKNGVETGLKPNQFPKGTTFTHNHPFNDGNGGGTFSLGDIETLTAVKNMREMRAVGIVTAGGKKFRVEYSLQRNPGAPKLTRKQTDAILDAHHEFQTGTHTILAKAITDIPTRQAYWRKGLHQQVIKTSKALGYTYTRTATPII